MATLSLSTADIQAIATELELRLKPLLQAKVLDSLPDTLTTREVAHILRVSVATIHNYTKQGKRHPITKEIIYLQGTPGRYTKTDVLTFQQNLKTRK